MKYKIIMKYPKSVPFMEKNVVEVLEDKDIRTMFIATPPFIGDEKTVEYFIRGTNGLPEQSAIEEMLKDFKINSISVEQISQ